MTEIKVLGALKVEGGAELGWSDDIAIRSKWGYKRTLKLYTSGLKNVYLSKWAIRKSNTRRSLH